MNDTGASTAARGKARDAFTDEERAAMRERAKEVTREARRGPRATNANAEKDVLAKIAEMEEADRVVAEGIHAIVMASAPELTPKLWYGMPAYAKGAKVVCFFQAAAKFKTRYATFGFSEAANLDEGTMWPTAYGLTKLTAADEETIRTLVTKAVS